MGEKIKLGIALCGSYCTYEKVFEALESLKDEYELIPIMSENASETDSRFGTAYEHKKELRRLSGREPVCSIRDAEPLGPKEPLDLILIAPCTGNTLAKLSHGITDTAVLMAAKAHMRNGRPLLIALSTNDGLMGSAENIARLLNRKNVYFVPFGQDAPDKKPYSLQADFSRLKESIDEALKGRQIQPILRK